MPNMSRRSLEHHQDRINEMATNNPVQESYIRSRYQTSYDKFQKFDTSIDSQDEFDADEFDAYRTTSIYQKREEKTSIIRRFFTAIVTFIFTTWHKTSRIFTSETDYRSVRYTRLNENKGMAAVWRMKNFSITELMFFFRKRFLLQNDIVIYIHVLVNISLHLPDYRFHTILGLMFLTIIECWKSWQETFPFIVAATFAITVTSWWVETYFQTSNLASVRK